MNRTRTRSLTGVLVAGGLLLALAPMASATSTASTLTLTPNVEAWFQPDPTCQLPTGCLTTTTLPVTVPGGLAVPAVDPYPVGTDHVGVTGGMESARTYLQFPLSQLAGRTVTAATLTIPLDTSTQDGTTLPEDSKVIVCETTQATITASEGTQGAPPLDDCTNSAPATYVATPAPHLEAALGKMAADLPDISGLALLPDAAATTSTDAWSVAWAAHTNTTLTTGPASLAVSYDDAAPAAVSAGGVPVEQPSQAPVVIDAGTGLLGSGSLPESAPQDPVPAAQVAAPPASAPGVVTADPASQVTQYITVGYAYPAVWLLPFAFLILIPAIGRVVTKDLDAR